MSEQLDWLKGYRDRRDGPTPHTQTARYSLKDLAARGLLHQDAVNGMLLDTGLSDFTWHMVWDLDDAVPDAALENQISSTEGYAIFIHGWTGSNKIWETLPGMVVNQRPQLVALVVDHNGFGETPFVAAMPAFEVCSPIAAMRAVERWFDLLGLRRHPGDRTPKTVNFVGHSMGAAALFFLDESKWRLGEQTRIAIAPALLLRDDLHRAFYDTLGLGIGLVGRLPFLESIERLVSPRILDALVDGATEAVKEEHRQIYWNTPRGVTARTLASMGILRDTPMTTFHWDLMKVILGHRDLLVGLIPMLDLLQELNFDVEQVRVVMGTHYLFSVGDDMARVHRQNRDLVLHDILKMHDWALQRQKGG